MSLLYIVDGCNVINHPAFAREEINKKLKDGRLALLALIRAKKLTGSPKNRVVVVFDGYPAFGGNKAPALDGLAIKVIFSFVKTADDLIRKIIEALSIPKNTVVISDDKEVRFFAKSSGASAISVQEFMDKGEKPQESVDDSSKPSLSYTQLDKINRELKKLWLK